MSGQKSRIEGRVAAIVNARELIINVGSEHGVEVGMKFAVLAETPLVVCDPMTGKELDQIDQEKTRVAATDVRPMVSICRTYRVKKIPAGRYYLGALWDIGNQATPPKEVAETLRIDDASVPPPLPEEQSYVKIKDRVMQVSDE